MASYEAFYGDKCEDVDHFLRQIKLLALQSNRDDEAFKLQMVDLLLEG